MMSHLGTGGWGGGGALDVTSQLQLENITCTFHLKGGREAAANLSKHDFSC